MRPKDGADHPGHPAPTSHRVTDRTARQQLGEPGLIVARLPSQPPCVLRSTLGLSWPSSIVARASWIPCVGPGCSVEAVHEALVGSKGLFADWHEAEPSVEAVRSRV